MKKLLLPLLSAFLICSCSGPQTLEQVKSKFAAIDSISIHYKIEGHGSQSIVFVHGFGCDMNAWQEQFSHFSKKFRMVFIDLPGFGMSDKPHTEYTLDLFADAVRAVLNKENINNATLVGHSLGTPVCRQVVFNYPELAGKRVDIDGVYCFYPADSAMIAAYKAFAESFKGPDIKQTIEGFVNSLCIPQTPQKVRDYALSTMPETPEYVAYSTMSNLVDEKCWTGQPIIIPTLVIAAVNSQIPPDYEEILSPLYPNMEYHELDSVGHFIMMEKPELFNKMLDVFLK